MKSFTTTLIISALASSMLTAEELPAEAKATLAKMTEYLKKEEEAYKMRQTKIYEYYIKALKEQKAAATQRNDQKSTTAINEALIKILKQQGITPDKGIATFDNNGGNILPSAPTIKAGASWDSVSEFVEKNDKKILVVEVQPTKISEEIKIKGKCLICPYFKDEWSFGMRKRLSYTTFLGHRKAKHQINGNNPGSLCYSVNDGPWVAVKGAEVVEVKGNIKFSSNLNEIKSRKFESKGSIRVRVLAVK